MCRNNGWLVVHLFLCWISLFFQLLELYLQAEEFRNFWKEKSDLRRFPDGSIREAVVWPSDTLADRRMICSRIVKHILSRLADTVQSVKLEFTVSSVLSAVRLKSTLWRLLEMSLVVNVFICVA